MTGQIKDGDYVILPKGSEDYFINTSNNPYAVTYERLTFASIIVEPANGDLRQVWTVESAPVDSKVVDDYTCYSIRPRDDPSKSAGAYETYSIKDGGILVPINGRYVWKVKSTSESDGEYQDVKIRKVDDPLFWTAEGAIPLLPEEYGRNQLWTLTPAPA